MQRKKPPAPAPSILAPYTPFFIKSSYIWFKFWLETFLDKDFFIFQFSFNKSPHCLNLELLSEIENSSHNFSISNNIGIFCFEVFCW